MNTQNTQTASEARRASGIEALKASAKKLTSRVWNPEEVGEHLVGQLVGVDTHVGDHDSTMLRFVDPHGNEVATWQRGTLKTRVTEAQMGKYLLIEFTGTEPAKKKGMSDMFVFDVYSLTQKQFDEYGKANRELSF